ncbi:MAG TPA: hypothetical protein VGU22_06840 [Methylomirabilota bacterium]|nr:hypothetical protein [Methylomirabilota bacterium]
MSTTGRIFTMILIVVADRPLPAGDVLITCADHDQRTTLRKIVTEG